MRGGEITYPPGCLTTVISQGLQNSALRTSMECGPLTRYALDRQLRLTTGTRLRPLHLLDRDLRNAVMAGREYEGRVKSR